MPSTKYTPDMLIAHKALVANAEGCIETRVGGFQWRAVYLDNAKPDGWSGRKWAGVLSQLERVGCYCKIDDTEFNGAFGDVRLPVGAL